MKFAKGGGLFCLLLLVAMSLAVAGPVAAQEKGKEETVVTKAQKGSATAKDDNIKNTESKNDPKSATRPPEDRGGVVRGAGPWPCYVRVQNWTPWKVIVWVDGFDVGMVPKYGDLLVRTGNGASTAYAKAVFSDGSALTWGTQVFNCVPSLGYVWQLKP